MPTPETPAIGEETIQPGEAQLVSDFTAFLKKSSATRYRAGAMRITATQREAAVLDRDVPHRRAP